MTPKKPAGDGRKAAAAKLQPFEHFAINAGGDLYLAGHNKDGEQWRVGVRNPRQTDELVDTR